jgi:hypothetical protein
MQFRASPDYGPFAANLGKLLAKPLFSFDFDAKPFPPTILGTAPVIEVATFFQTEDFFLSNVEKFMAAVSPYAEGYLGHVYGPTIGEVEKEEGAGKGKAVVLCVGWEGKEKHMAFRETEAFAKNIHLLREGAKGSEMVSNPTKRS